MTDPESHTETDDPLTNWFPFQPGRTWLPLVAIVGVILYGEVCVGTSDQRFTQPPQSAPPADRSSHRNRAAGLSPTRVFVVDQKNTANEDLQRAAEKCKPNSSTYHIVESPSVVRFG